ncbi:MAG: serine/threonine-protein kinase [Bacillota bacterium]|nr:serine/threonine-protein kinase [Bacillota bacterium]
MITNGLNPGTIIGNRYEVRHEIGRGGFGITYEAWDRTLSQKVALKEYYPKELAVRVSGTSEVTTVNQESAASFNSGKTKFLDEARMIVQFNKLPGVIHVNDYMEENGTAYIVMEFVEGVVLEEYLKGRVGGRLSAEEAIRIGQKLAEALYEIHSKGTIHRDVSLSNIMINDKGDVTLLDFGAAREFEAERTKTMSVILKTGYAPPEQYSSKSRQDARTDIYALGALMYRMATGKMPADSLSRAEHDELVKPRDINPDIPKWLQEIILKCMQLQPQFRYKSTKELLKDLEFGLRNGDKGQGKKAKGKALAIIAIIFAVVVCSSICVLTVSEEKSDTAETGNQIFKEEYEVIDQGEGVFYRANGNTGNFKMAGMYVTVTNNTEDRYITGYGSIKATDENSSNILAAYFDDSDVLEARVDEYCTSTAVILPGQTVTFALGNEVLDSKEVNIKSFFNYGETYSQNDLKHSEFIPLEVEVERMSGDTEVVVYNKNNYAIDMATVFIVSKDSDGKILYADYVDFYERIEPNSSARTQVWDQYIEGDIEAIACPTEDIFK